MLNQELPQGTKILNSLQATSIFEKSDHTKIMKSLQRQKVDLDGVTLMAIHKVNHWLFVKLTKTKL